MALLSDGLQSRPRSPPPPPDPKGTAAHPRVSSSSASTLMRQRGRAYAERDRFIRASAERQWGKAVKNTDSILPTIHHLEAWRHGPLFTCRDLRAHAQAIDIERYVSCPFFFPFLSSSERLFGTTQIRPRAYHTTKNVICRHVASRCSVPAQRERPGTAGAEYLHRLPLPKVVDEPPVGTSWPHKEEERNNSADDFLKQQHPEAP